MIIEYPRKELNNEIKGLVQFMVHLVTAYDITDSTRSLADL